jgi:hypothetical protein
MVGAAMSRYPWLTPKRKVPTLAEAVDNGTRIVLHPEMVSDALMIRRVGIEAWVTVRYRARLLNRDLWNDRQQGHPLYRPTAAQRTSSQAQLRKRGKDAVRLCKGCEDGFLLSLVPEDDRQAVLALVDDLTAKMIPEETQEST